MHEAPSPSGVHRFLNVIEARVSREKDDPCHRRQLRHPQTSQRHGIAQKPSAVCLPLHPSSASSLNAIESFYANLAKKRLSAASSDHCGTQRRHPPLPRPHQRKPKAPYLDQGSKRNHRRCQTGTPNVPFDPLAWRDRNPAYLRRTRTLERRFSRSSDRLRQDGSLRTYRLTRFSP